MLPTAWAVWHPDLLWPPDGRHCCLWWSPAVRLGLLGWEIAASEENIQSCSIRASSYKTNDEEGVFSVHETTILSVFWLKLWIPNHFQRTDVSEILVKWRWNDSLVINTKVSNLLIFTTEAFTAVNWSIDYQLLAINRTEFAGPKFKTLCSV